MVDQGFGYGRDRNDDRDRWDRERGGNFDSFSSPNSPSENRSRGYDENRGGYRGYESERFGGQGSQGAWGAGSSGSQGYSYGSSGSSGSYDESRNWNARGSEPQGGYGSQGGHGSQGGYGSPGGYGTYGSQRGYSSRESGPAPSGGSEDLGRDWQRGYSQTPYGGSPSGSQGSRYGSSPGEFSGSYSGSPYSGSQSYGPARYGSLGYGQPSAGRESYGSPGYGSQGYGPGSWENGEPMPRGRFTGRGPKGYQRSDERIREDVSERLERHPEVDASEIEVRVASGEVTLEGTVDDRQQKKMAEEAVESCPGVKDVHNHLKAKQGFMASLFGTREENREREKDNLGSSATTSRSSTSSGSESKK